jgi:hypothetical protein
LRAQETDQSAGTAHVLIRGDLLHGRRDGYGSRTTAQLERGGEASDAEKSRVAPTDKISFLGFSFRGAKVCWSAKTSARFQREVKRFTDRNWGVSMRRRLTELERYHGAIS